MIGSKVIAMLKKKISEYILCLIHIVEAVRVVLSLMAHQYCKIYFY